MRQNVSELQKQVTFTLYMLNICSAKVPNSWDPNQAQLNIGPDLDSICLQM